MSDEALNTIECLTVVDELDNEPTEKELIESVQSLACLKASSILKYEPCNIAHSI